MRQEQHELVLRQILGRYLTPAEQEPRLEEAELARACALLLDLVRSGDNVPRDADRCYRVCHAIAKQFDLYPEMRLLMRTRWQVKSMRQMELADLQSLVRFMRALESYINIHAR